MLKSMLFAALAMATAPALAQPGQGQPSPTQPPAGGPTPPPEFIQAAQAFGQCLSAGGRQLAATITPEAGASQVLAGCATQKAALETRFEGWVSSPAFPAEGRGIARQQFAAQLGLVEAQLADGIRRNRAGPTPAPAPSN